MSSTVLVDFREVVRNRKRIIKEEVRPLIRRFIAWITSNRAFRDRRRLRQILGQFIENLYYQYGCTLSPEEFRELVKEIFEEELERPKEVMELLFL